MLIGAASLGLVSGYILAAVAVTTETEWAWAFGAKIALLVALGGVMQFTTKYEDIDVTKRQSPAVSTADSG